VKMSVQEQTAAAREDPGFNALTMPAHRPA
jgi:hypothetical protein